MRIGRVQGSGLRFWGFRASGSRLGHDFFCRGGGDWGVCRFGYV